MKRRKFLAILAAVLLILVAACGIYVADYYRADDAVVQALAPSDSVAVVQQEGMVLFLPETAEAGFLFYPGGKVEHTAYAPLMRALAEQNVLCVLLEMPFRLAVLDSNAAEGIPEQFPEVERWFIGGHSLGGSMAAAFAADQRQSLEGLVLLAAYSTADLQESGLRVLSLYGSRDGVLDLEKYQKYYGNLPENTQEIRIEGGNHAGFGSYGHQEGDGEAAIAPEEQLRITAEAILRFLEKP